MQETQFDSWVRKIPWRRDRPPTPAFLGFPCGSAGKDSSSNAGDLGSVPGWGRSPGEGNGHPLQHSGLENSMGCIVHGATKTRTRLSDFHFPFGVGGGGEKYFLYVVGTQVIPVSCQPPLALRTEKQLPTTETQAWAHRPAARAERSEPASGWTRRPSRPALLCIRPASLSCRSACKRPARRRLWKGSLRSEDLLSGYK